jgi:TPR repeat protein
MRNLIKTFILMLMLSVSHAAIAGDYEDGLAAGEKGDFATALRLWTPLAEQGDAKAQYNLGFMFEEGKDVAQDYKTAVKWFTLAAKQGNYQAQYSLGIMYDVGKGVEQDYVKAHMWLSIAVSADSSLSPFRDYIAKKMNPAQIEKAQETANRCVKQNFKNCD